MSSRKNFSRSGAAVLLSVFGLIGFDNNIDSRVDAMDPGQNFIDTDTRDDSGDDNNFCLLNNVDNNNFGTAPGPGFEPTPEPETEKMDEKKSSNSGGNGNDVTASSSDEKSNNRKDDNDVKDNDNNKWSTGKKVGVITAIAVCLIAIVGGAVLLWKRMFGKKNTQKRGLPPKNLNQNFKLNTNLNSSNNLNQKSTNHVK
ncbi:MAG: hypothetical protein J6P21_00265 [Clostridia bacterium]|nr:hypothetical protein [Clostridia bacterium]